MVTGNISRIATIPLPGLIDWEFRAACKITQPPRAGSVNVTAYESATGKHINIGSLQTSNTIYSWRSTALNAFTAAIGQTGVRSEEHTSELQSLMRISYAVFCLKKK